MFLWRIVIILNRFVRKGGVKNGRCVSKCVFDYEIFSNIDNVNIFSILGNMYGELQL